MLESVCACVCVCVHVPSCTCARSKQPRSTKVVDVEGGQERLLRRLVDSRAAQGEVNGTCPLSVLGCTVVIKLERPCCFHQWSFQTEGGILC